ncbi:MAG: cytochrome c oxidase subunit II [Pseudomonadota bacterium]
MSFKKIQGTAATFIFMLLSVWAGGAAAEMGVNFPEPAAEVARDIYNVHMLTMKIGTIIMVILFAFLLYSLYFHRKSRGYGADQTFHETWFARWAWVLVPTLVLSVDLTIANTAEKTLERIWNVPKDKDKNMLDVKVIGHQWWWEFQYPAQGITVESRFVPKEKTDDLYLRDVDHQLVLPTGRNIRFLHTSMDVNHIFWVPELAVKKDAIAGYVTETWVNLDREGVFRGQCAELCGTWHSRMPIVVASVSPEKFDVWVNEQKQIKLAAAAEATASKDWTKEELLDKGHGLYDTKCGACHQVTGMGLPPAFPALKGSKIATGLVTDHLKVVLNGRPGTAMVSWSMLNDLEIAAIVTYERNAWGNNTGDVVKPADVKSAR